MHRTLVSALFPCFGALVSVYVCIGICCGQFSFSLVFKCAVYVATTLSVSCTHSLLLQCITDWLLINELFSYFISLLCLLHNSEVNSLPSESFGSMIASSLA